MTTKTIANTLPACVEGIDRERMLWLPEALRQEWPGVDFHFTCKHLKRGEVHTHLSVSWLNGPSAARMALVMEHVSPEKSVEAKRRGDGSWNLRVGSVHVEADPVIDPHVSALALVRSLSEVADLEHLSSWVKLDFDVRTKAAERAYEKALTESKVANSVEEEAARVLLSAANMKDVPSIAREVRPSLLDGVKRMESGDIDHLSRLLSQI